MSFAPNTNYTFIHAFALLARRTLLPLGSPTRLGGLSYRIHSSTSLHKLSHKLPWSTITTPLLAAFSKAMTEGWARADELSRLRHLAPT